MALSRYVLTPRSRLAPGHPHGWRARNRRRCGVRHRGPVGWRLAVAADFLAGTAIILDPTGPLYAALSGNLRAYVQGQDDRGGAALSN